MSIANELLAEIDTLNCIPRSGPPLRADCSDAELEQARAEFFEFQVEREAYRIASNNGRTAPQDYEINALKPTIRARMKAARPNATGVLGKLKQTLARLTEIDGEREQLTREEAELVQLQLQLESLLNQRKDYITKIERARGHLTKTKALTDSLNAETTGLFLKDYDNAHGSDILGAVHEVYRTRATCELILADAPRLEREWVAGLTALDKEIAAFQQEHDLN